jgi:hypothetical protein
MTRLEEARWLARELYNLVLELKGNNVETGNQPIDDYLKDNDTEWIEWTNR